MASSQAVKRKLSGSTDGKPIKVTSTETSGAVIIHTSVAGTTDGTYDEIWLWAYNSHTSAVTLYIEYGDFELPLQITIPSGVGKVPIEPGIPFQNSLTIKAYASVADVLAIQGFVNHITD